MKAEELIAHYPRLYHMAAAGRWESIREHGLLSTSALLDKWEIEGAEREALESAHRPKSEAIEHPVHGTAIVRDQKPMSDGMLRACLQGMEPSEWYRLLNRQVFFWPTEHRLKGLLAAYPGTQLVLTLDTAPLVRRYADQIRLSPLNSGATRHVSHTRGLRTFCPIEEYPFDERRKKAGLRDAVAELTVDYAVPDVRDFVLRAEHRNGDDVEIVWARR